MPLVRITPRPAKTYRMSWMTYNCPLAVDQTLKMGTPRTGHQSDEKTKAREDGFVVDAVVTAVNACGPRQSVIPPYNAKADKYASAYFQSPTVRGIISRSEDPQTPEVKKDHNKLSTRKRCKATPTTEQLRQRQKNFVVDSVKEGNSRSRFHDVIPPYQADHDRNCKQYFQRRDIKKLLNVTLSPR